MRAFRTTISYSDDLTVEETEPMPDYLDDALDLSAEVEWSGKPRSGDDASKYQVSSRNSSWNNA